MESKGVFNSVSFVLILIVAMASAMGAKAQDQDEHRSKPAKYTFGDTLAEQQRQLKTNPLMKEFEASRQEKSFISIDGSRASLLGGIESRAPETTSVDSKDGETIELRVFVDKSVVEVFANGQKYMGMRVFPSLKESVGISLRSQGEESVVKSLNVWQMRSIWDTDEVDP